MTVKRPRGLAVLALICASGGGSASAHPELSALGTNRYVTAAVFDGRVDVTDAWLEGALASGAERRRLDADGDGRISEAERRAGEARLRDEGAPLAVEIDGRALDGPVEVSIDLGDEPRATDAPLVVERRLSVKDAWRAGARRLRLVVTREPERLLDTELGVVIGPGYALPPGARDLVTFRGPRASTLEERAATFEIVAPQPPRDRRPLIAIAAAGVLLGLGASLALHRRHRRSTART
jgi:hypothetical protein